MGAEDVLVSRKLENTVEDDVKEKMARATTQLLEAQSRLAEWQSEDERRAREAQEAADAEARRAQEVRDARRRDALAAEERRRAAQRPTFVAGSGTLGSGSTPVDRPEAEKNSDVVEIPSDAEDDSTPVPRTRRRASAIRAGKRKVVESDGGEPEHYVSCMQIKVTGGAASGTPGPTVKFPGAYKATDAYANFSIYNGRKAFPMPGPAVWNGASSAGGSSTTPAKEEAAPPAAATTLATAVAPPAAAPTAAAPAAGAVAKYAQCGGKNFKGATSCVAGSTCKAANEWYSQCL